MHQPCENCPFRKDIPPFPLGRDRRSEIAHSILNDKDFPCHKTTSGSMYNWRPCIGAVLFAENVLGDCRANLMFRLYCLNGHLDPNKLDRTIPTLNTFDEFVFYEEN